MTWLTKVKSIVSQNSNFRRDHYATALQVEFLKSPDGCFHPCRPSLGFKGTESLTDAAGDRHLFMVGFRAGSKSGGGSFQRKPHLLILK